MEIPQTERFTFHEVLGEGSCGRVYRCTSPEGEERAVKVLTAMAINRDLMRFTLRRLEELPGHPGIAKVYYYSLADTPYHYVMDLYADPVLDEKGEEPWRSRRLDGVIGKIDREEAWKLVDQMAEAVSFLHSHDLFHGCLKPSNVFLVKGDPGSEIKISDPAQGWVTGAHYLELHDIPFYASPEQLRTAEFLDGHGKRWDVYSFGVLSFLLLNGRLPRLGEKFEERHGGGKSWVGDGGGLAIDALDKPPHEYADLLEASLPVLWDFAPKDEAEAKKLKVLTRCLDLNPEERFGDMLEVVDHFRRDRLAEEVSEIEELSRGWKERVMAPMQQAGRLTTVLAILLGVGIFAFGVQHLVLRHAKDKVAKAERTVKAAVAAKDEEIEEVKEQVEAANQLVAKTRAMEESARSQLGEAHRFGDDVFSIVKGHRGIEALGYQKDRQEVLARGREYFQEFIKKNADNENLVEETVVARGHLVAILKETGGRDETLAALEEYRSSIAKVLEEKPDDPLWISRQALVSEESARIYLERDEVELASEAGRKALALREQLAKLGSSEGMAAADSMYDLAGAWTLVGEIERERKDMKKATAALTGSVEILMPLHEALPDQAKYRFRLAENFAMLGSVMTILQDVEGSVSMHDKAVEMLSDLVRDEPENDEYAHQLARSFVVLGEIQSEDKVARDALALLKRLTTKDPDKESYRHSLAMCYGVLSELQRDHGEAKNAKELQEMARDMLTELVEQHPQVREYRFGLAASLSRLAGLSEDAGKYNESLANYSAAAKVVEELMKASPDNIQYQRALAELRGNIGFANEKVGNKEKAKELYASAVVQWERLASLLPKDDLVERGLLWSRRQLAALDR